MGREPLEAPKQLLVEGKDELGFFQELLQHMGADTTELEIKQHGGKNRFREFLAGNLPFPPTFHNKRVDIYQPLQTLAVVRDADNDPAGAFQSVCDALKNAGYEPPAKPGQFTGDDLRIGVLILPDAKSPGMLEDLCLRALEQESILTCVDKYVACLKETGLTITNEAKSRFYTYVSSRPKPGSKLGEAAKAGYIPFASPAFDGVKAFLNAM